MLLDGTVMNVSIDEVVQDLDTTVNQMQLAITLYTLVMASMMMFGGRLGDIIGRRLAFRIGVVLFAAGAGITAIAPNIGVLILGWSILEGLGSALMLPAIAALIAGNYEGRDRATCFGILGGVAAAGASAGPIIGGFVATEWSWRVVFASEVVIMIGLLLASGVIRDTKRLIPRPHLDGVGAALSASGLAIAVLGIVESDQWGWITPKGALTIGGTKITPFGFSIVPFLIMAGLGLIWAFIEWEQRRTRMGLTPLVDLGLLAIKRLRAGLMTYMSVQLTLVGTFFALPLYLQIVLGKDPIETGVRVLPLSIGVLVISLAAAPLSARFAPRRIVQFGMGVVLVGTFALLGSIKPALAGWEFGISMAMMGMGLGFVYSQLGNINMSSVGPEQTSQVGGLQGTAQNLGGALGTALIGSVLLTGLGAAFDKQVQSNPDVPAQVRQEVTKATAKGLPFVPAGEVTTIAEKQGLPKAESQQLSNTYDEAQITALKTAIGAVAVLIMLSFWFTRHLPMERLVKSAGRAPPAEE